MTRVVTPDALDRVERTLKERIDALTALHEVQRVADARALNLQAAEYERRLDVLNHNHTQAAEAAARTVPRETFEAFKEKLTAVGVTLGIGLIIALVTFGLRRP